MNEIIPNLNELENDKERLIADTAWQLATLKIEPDIQTAIEHCGTEISIRTGYRWMPQINAKYDEFRKIIDEQQKMSLKLGIEASDILADKFVTHEYGVIKDRLYNSTRGKFMDTGEVDLSKIVPDDHIPIPDQADPEYDVREEIWRNMNNPKYNSDIDPDYDEKKRINEAELSGVDEVIAKFEKMRKGERDSIQKADIDAVLTHFEKLRNLKENKIYNDFINDFSPYYHW
ncbi:MAG: hypothetical protein M1529_01905 [Candidatus Thermoplasmatota archaeon]|jgi:hypothetical protein|nr:hypothetical protein [Candidatus Thermoplasmatota archaeon]